MSNIVERVKEKIQGLEVYSHTDVTSKEVYEKRINCLNEIIEMINEEISKGSKDAYELNKLRCRVIQSMSIMKLANQCGVIK